MSRTPWVVKKNMISHLIGRVPLEKIEHGINSNTWKHVDEMCKDFSKEPQHIQLWLATNKFNSFGLHDIS